MEVLSLNADSIDECAIRASAILKKGGVFLYPTDTLYGLGADAFSDEAVARVYDIKDRNERKPIHCIVADLAMARQYAEIDDRTKLLAENFLPGPLTLILRKKMDVGSGIARGMSTIGIRIPKNEFCLATARRFGRPYSTTSANKSGAISLRTTTHILAQLSETARMIDLVIDAGELPESKPSTIVDLSGSEARILREGAVSSDALAGFL